MYHTLYMVNPTHDYLPLTKDTTFISQQMPRPKPARLKAHHIPDNDNWSHTHRRLARTATTNDHHPHGHPHNHQHKHPHQHHHPHRHRHQYPHRHHYYPHFPPSHPSFLPNPGRGPTRVITRSETRLVRGRVGARLTPNPGRAPTRQGTSRVLKSGQVSGPGSGPDPDWRLVASWSIIYHAQLYVCAPGTLAVACLWWMRTLQSEERQPVR
mmetsp:Transcript_43494/g.80487  ORF Transcript_43494/g.80487 Transcript_43494/m.80487 type:complete len:211 (+) Transcript_43494:402-1034(+)